jgi:hypothetical protein
MTPAQIIRAFVLQTAVPIISNRAGPPTARGLAVHSSGQPHTIQQVRA